MGKGNRKSFCSQGHKRGFQVGIQCLSSPEVFSHSSAKGPRETAGHVRSDFSMEIRRGYFPCSEGSKIPRILFPRFPGKEGIRRILDGHQSEPPKQFLGLQAFPYGKHLLTQESVIARGIHSDPGSSGCLPPCSNIQDHQKWFFLAFVPPPGIRRNKGSVF